jgi:cytochrome b561
MTHKSIRKTVGGVVLIMLLVSFPRMQAIVNTIEAHPWIGIILLLCAVAYVLWGMFWE